MAYVGAQYFRWIDGPVPISTPAISSWTRPGVDGMGYDNRGIHGKVTTVVGRNAFSSAANRANFVLQCINLIGSIVTVTDNFNKSWGLIMVKDARELRSFNTLSDTDSQNYHLEMEFTLESTATSYGTFV